MHLQLHVLPDELLDWVEQWRDEFGLSIAKITYQPKYSARDVHDFHQLRKSVAAGKAPDELWLSLRPFKLSHVGKTATEDANRNALFISFPFLSRDGLLECLLGSESKAVTNAKLWKLLMGRVKRSCGKGLWVLNPKQHIKKFYSNIYYTSGAGEASRKGLALLPIAGGNVMSVEEPDLE
jgi:hypothetical protein